MYKMLPVIYDEIELECGRYALVVQSTYIHGSAVYLFKSLLHFRVSLQRAAAEHSHVSAYADKHYHYVSYQTALERLAKLESSNGRN